MTKQGFRYALPRVCALIALASVAFTHVAFAQNETAVLTGRVIDPAGLGVPAAKIHLTEEATGAARDAIPQADGLYRFELLPPGRYSIRASANGFRTVEDTQ